MQLAKRIRVKKFTHDDRLSSTSRQQIARLISNFLKGHNIIQQETIRINEYMTETFIFYKEGD